MEVVKLLASLLIPLSIALVGFLVQRALAAQSRSWKSHDRIVEKRIEVYEKIAEDLNRIYCYVMDVGTFRGETPDTIIAAKRNVDKFMYIYQAIWSEDTFRAFEEYQASAFATYQGIGEDAGIRSPFEEKRVARERRNEAWLAGWNERFTGERDPKHGEKYRELVRLLSRDLMLTIHQSPD
ncbi:MAG TPA: hypothetical protein VK363_00070 [Pyrinomonadaceae bacterium]|nr:hypothetical protein [Pyrinomonadaceae bacterium]